MRIAARRMAAGLLLLGLCLVPGGERAEQVGVAVAASAPVPSDAARFALPRAPQQGLVMVAVAPAGAASVTLDGANVALAPDGRFVLAFDRDAPPRATLSARLRDGRAVDQQIAVAPGNWRIERINAPYRGSAGNDAEFARRRPAELAQIAAARSVAGDSGGWRQSFVWPVRGRLSGFFGSQRVYQGKPGTYHSGLDIAVPTGTPFVAPADGIVVLAAKTPFTLEGNLLIVDHGMGLTSAFLHAARLDVSTGQAVRQGQLLGTVGATGRATGPHLHWGMRWGQARLDPLPILPR